MSERTQAIDDRVAEVAGRADVPRLADRLALIGGQEAEEEVLRLHAQVIHVETRCDLMRDVAEDVEARDEVVVQPLEDRVIHHPGGLRDLAHETLDDGCVVEVPEDGQPRIRVLALAVPDPIERRPATLGIDGIVEFLARFEVGALLAGVFEPQLPRTKIALVLGGKVEQRRRLLQEAGNPDREIVRRIQEGDPELILDHVDGDVPAADRSADEGHDEILRVVEQILVAAGRRDCVEGDEWIRRHLRRVGRKLRGLPIAVQEELAQAVALRFVQRIHDVRLVHDRGSDRPQSIPEVRGAGIVIRAHRGDHIDRLARRRPRAHHLEERARREIVEAEVGQEPVLVQIPAGDALL